MLYKLYGDNIIKALLSGKEDLKIVKFIYSVITLL